MTIYFDYTKFDNIRDVCLSIYKITNIQNKKVYVGKSKGRLIGRIIKHCHHVRKGTNRYLYDAIRHYGWNNFSVEVLEICTLEELDEREIYWIATLRSNNKDFGYNMTEGGDGGGNGEILKQYAKNRIGIPMSEEQKKKISDVLKGRPGRIPTEKVKEKISRKLKGIMPSKPIHIIIKERSLPPARLGIKHTKETKLLMSLNNDHKCHQTKEQLDQRSDAWKGSSNPLWVEISKEELSNLIVQKLYLKDIALKLNVSIPTVLNKIKLLFNVNGLIEARKLLIK